MSSNTFNTDDLTEEESEELRGEPEIVIDDLRKEFSVPSGTEIAVDGVSLDIYPGEFVSLVGPSGCGKTTTLRCLAGLETPTSGSIICRGRDLTEVPANKRNFGMMFQNIALYPHMSIIDNISYPLKVRNVPKDERYEEAEAAAEIMQISELLDKSPGDLSGGQRQRAALARTIVQDPVAFLMDEPLSDLDAKLKVDIRKEIQKLHKRLGKPTIYVTHDQEEAMTMSDRIVVMNNGKIEQVGTRDELYLRPENTFVASFIGNPSINYLPGKVVELDNSTGTVTAYGEELQFDVENLQLSQWNSEILVAFRPPAVRLHSNTSDAVFTGKIQIIDPIDDRAHAIVAGPDGEIRAQIPSNQSLVEDDEVGIDIDQSEILLFDQESGELVAVAE